MSDTIRALWPRWREVTEDIGLWCWGCGRRAGFKDTQPTRWIEVLCRHDDCPVNKRRSA